MLHMWLALLKALNSLVARAKSQVQMDYKIFGFITFSLSWYFYQQLNVSSSYFLVFTPLSKAMCWKCDWKGGGGGMHSRCYKITGIVPWWLNCTPFSYPLMVPVTCKDQRINICIIMTNILSTLGKTTRPLLEEDSIVHELILSRFSASQLNVSV